MSDAVERLPLTALAAASGFRQDARFARPSDQRGQSAQGQLAEPEDPIAMAFTEGFNAGVAEAQAIAAEQAKADAGARESLMLALSRLDAQMEEELRLKLRDTVATLCELAIAPLALDEDALVRRIETATAMLRRADDERVIRLHPDDLELVSPRLAQDWQVVPDPSLERGALRVESANGGVEDGPDVWRRAIAEALHQC
ncbi:MAG: flagellar biosynthesis protein [Novosphingobium sp.]|nr:flagellar biosynthesis protein [Novosphingobium sp.]MCP5401079.1 flagellar biosynthesis protein [Novosphingobium sp.]